MAKAFNPYSEWLEIPADQCPPNHYVMLGLELFETDPGIINARADERMALVRTFQTGPHSSISQRMLNELSAARVCLTNLNKKTAYDAKLRQQQLVGSDLAPLSAAAADPFGVPAVGSDPTFDPSSSDPFAMPAGTIPLGSGSAVGQGSGLGRGSGVQRGSGIGQGSHIRPGAPGAAKMQEGSPPWLVPAVIGGGAVGLLLIVGLIVLMFSGGESTIADGGSVTDPTGDPHDNIPDIGIALPKGKGSQPVIAPPVVAPPVVVPPVVIDPPETVDPPIIVDPPVVGDPPDVTPVTVDPPTVEVTPRVASVLPLDVPEGEIRAFEHPNNPGAVEFSADGRLGYASGAFREVYVWDLATGAQKMVLRGNRHMSWDLAVSHDGRWVAAAGFDSRAYIWDTQSGQLVHTLEGHTGRVTGVAISPDDRYILTCGYDMLIRMWDLPTGRYLRTFGGHEAPVIGVAWLPDSQRFLSGSGTPHNRDPDVRDNTLRIWNIEGESLGILSGHADAIDSVDVSADGRFALTSSYDTTAAIWDLQSRQRLHIFPHSSFVKHAAFSPEGSRILTCTVEGLIQLWDIASKKTIKEFTLRVPVECVQFSADGNFALAAVMDRRVRLFRLPDVPGGVPLVSGSQPVHRDPVEPVRPVVPVTPPDPVTPVIPPQVTVPPVVDRKPVPSDTAQSETLSVVKDIYARDYEKTELEDRRELAEKLYTEGLATNDDPVGRYVLLCESIRVAGECQAIETAWTSIEALSEEYEVKPLELKAQALAAMATHTQKLTDYRAVARQYVVLMGEAVSAEAFELALSLIEPGQKAAKEGKDTQLAIEIGERTAGIEASKQLFEAAQAAADTLAAAATDPAANLVLGSYRGVHQGRWNEALPMLVQAGDDPLAELARRDTAGATDPAAQADLGDSWWEYANELADEPQLNVRRRATLWYRRALPHLRGLTKVKVDKRLALVPDIPRPEPAAGARPAPVTPRTPSGGDPVASGVGPIAPYNAEFELAIAQWVISRRGMISLQGSTGYTRTLPAGDVRLRGVNTGSGEVSAADVARLASLSSIEELRLYRPNISPQGLEPLARLKSLTSFDISGARLSDSSLAPLAALPHLAKLRISETGGMTSAGWSALPKFPALTELSINSPTLDDDAIQYFAGISGLQTLSFYNGKCTGATLGRLASLGNLTRLSISSAQLLDASLTQLAQLDNVTTLSVRGPRLTDRGVTPLGNMRNLTSLTIQAPGMTDAGLASLSGLDSLRMLSLQDAAITGGSVVQLVGLKHLEILNFYGCKKLDSSKLAPLVQFKGLTRVNFSDCPVDDRITPILARMPELTDVVLANSHVTNAGLMALVASPKLQSAQCRGSGVTLDGVREFNERRSAAGRPPVRIYP